MRHSKRCRANHDRATGDIYWGRCELRFGHDGDHYLERGLMPVTWKTSGRNA